MSTHPME